MKSYKNIEYPVLTVNYTAFDTDEDNFFQYTPRGGGEYSENSESLEITDENEGFSLHQGKILSEKSYDCITTANYEEDYSEISSSGAVSMPEIVDLDTIYKGVRGNLIINWDKNNNNRVFPCFITEESFNESGVNLSLSGVSKLLEKNYGFDFSKMKRSEIIREIILTAGLTPVINTNGLVDNVIDYTNITSNSSDSTEYSGTLPADACSFAEKLCKGKTGKSKAQAIYDWIDENMGYAFYYDSRFNEQTIYNDVKQHLGAKRWNCCDHAHMSVVLLRCAGFKANYVHGPSHVWCVVYINGERIMFDPLGSQNRPMGQVWKGLTGTEMESISF